MRGWAVAGLIVCAGAGEVRAQDWRAVSTSHHDVVFVDAASVSRRADGRIAFRARHRLAENDSNRDFGYDRIDLAVTSRCRRGDAGLPPASSNRKYFLRDRSVAGPGWRDAEVVEDAALLAATICSGRIGYRGWPDLDPAMAEYGGHSSLERLAAHVTPEAELTGIVVQGFEMNGVSLCGEDSCRAAPPREFCWLEGPIHVPAPDGAPEWVGGGPRRDRAGAAFTGRIYRSRTGKGFGHMSAMGCLVEVTGSVRFVEVAPPKRSRIDHGAPGRRPEAITAHAAFAESIKAAARVEFTADDRRWMVDDFSPAASNGGGGGACYSLPRFGGDYVTPFAPALGWPGAKEISRRGAAITVMSDGYDDDLDLYLANEEAAEAVAAFVRRISDHGLAGIAQKKARVTLRYEAGRAEDFRFADAGAAVQAAGIAYRLLGREVAQVRQSGNRVTILPVRRQTLTFPDEAAAAEALRRMEALRAACAASESPA